MSKKHKKKKKQKQKVVYYDDNSTIADMSAVNRRGVKEEKKDLPKPPSTFKDKARTFLKAMKMMVGPMLIALLALCAIFALLYFLGQAA